MSAYPRFNNTSNIFNDSDNENTLPSLHDTRIESIETKTITHSSDINTLNGLSTSILSSISTLDISTNSIQSTINTMTNSISTLQSLQNGRPAPSFLYNAQSSLCPSAQLKPRPLSRRINPSLRHLIEL